MNFEAKTSQLYGCPKVAKGTQILNYHPINSQANCECVNVHNQDDITFRHIYNIRYMQMTMICTLLLNRHLVRTLTLSIEP